MICFWMSPFPQNWKDHAAHRRKWMSVSLEYRAMFLPFLLRTDGLSLRTGTGITISQRSLKLGTSTAQRWDSVAFFFIMTIPVYIQQQQWLTFLMRVRCSCCHTHHIRQTFLPATSSYFEKWKTTEGYHVWEHWRCMSSVHKGCWRHTQINLGWGVEQVVSLHGRMQSCWRKILWKNGVTLSGKSSQLWVSRNFWSILMYVRILLIPCGKFRWPYLGKATAAARAVLSIPNNVCRIFVYPNKDMAANALDL